MTRVAVIAFLLAACTKETGATQDVRRDTTVAPLPLDALSIDAMSIDAPDTSMVPEDWIPPMRLRRDISAFGYEQLQLAYDASEEFAGITFRYAKRAYSATARRGTYTLIAMRGGKTRSMDFVSDAEVTVFGVAIMIDSEWEQLRIRLIDEPSSRECSAFDIAQLWQLTGLGGETQPGYFYDLPDGAQTFEMDGMAHVDYRGVRVSCGSLSHRMFAERLP